MVHVVLENVYPLNSELNQSTSVQVSVVSSGAFRISWDAVPHTDCDKTRYTVSYHRTLVKCPCWVSSLYTTATSVVVSNFIEGAVYNITVRASNSKGANPPSEPLLYSVPQPSLSIEDQIVDSKCASGEPCTIA